MMRFSMRSLVLSSAAALVLVGGGLVWLQDSSAALSSTFPPSGQRTTCNLNRDPFININGGPAIATASTGAITATVGKVGKTSDGRDVAELVVESTLTKGTVKGVGDLTIANDTARSAASSLTANQAGRSFPATQVMQFFPVITINGETFTSSSAATLVNTSVPSFPAPAGTVYVLTNELTLKSEAGNTVTVQPGKAVTITGSSSS